MKHIYVVGTADTKGEELVYLASCVEAAGGRPVLVDVGTRRPTVMVDISAETVAAAHPGGAAAVLSGDDRGTAIAAMGEAPSNVLAMSHGLPSLRAARWMSRRVMSSPTA